MQTNIFELEAITILALGCGVLGKENPFHNFSFDQNYG